MAQNYYLMHHGVKGMKWGVRKTPERVGRARQRVRNGMVKTKGVVSRSRNYTGSRRSDALVRARHRDVNKMSNQELQETITRLNLERQYRQLTAVDFMAGQKHARNALKYEATYAAISRTPAVKAGKKAAFRKGAKAAAKIASA